jgi:transposase
VVTLGEIVLIHDLKRQGLTITAIARKVGLDRKTVRRYLERGLEPPAYSPRAPVKRLIAPYEDYLRERVSAYPELSGKRLLREIRELGYTGGYTAVTDLLREARPARTLAFERRFETPAGRQAQVDFAEFKVEFTDEPGVQRKVWLFSIVLGHSRWIWGRFCASQDLQTVLRCHIAAFEAIGGVTSEILYDRMSEGRARHRFERRPERGDRRERRRRRDLQHLARRASRALRQRTAGLSSVPGLHEGQGGAALSLCPAGLLPGTQLPQHR